MNKADLIAELADRMGGDHQLATEALEKHSLAAGGSSLGDATHYRAI